MVVKGPPPYGGMSLEHNITLLLKVTQRLCKEDNEWLARRHSVVVVWLLGRGREQATRLIAPAAPPNKASSSKRVT